MKSPILAADASANLRERKAGEHEVRPYLFLAGWTLLVTTVESSRLSFGSLQRLLEALLTIQRCLSQGCRLNKRKQNPNTYQLLLGGDIP